MSRRPTITTAQRVECWDKSGGICHICRLPIDPRKEKWEAEHVIPLALGGAKAWPNLRPAHVDCHKEKTAQDKGDIAKAIRRRAADIGARPAPVRKIASRNFSQSEKAARRQAKPKLEMLPEIYRRVKETDQ